MNPYKLIDLSLTYAQIKASRTFGWSPNKPMFLVLHVTNKCNLKCLMCDQWNNQELPDLDTKTWMHTIKDAKSIGVKHISFTGGEPFIRSDIYDLIKFTRIQKLHCHICTNVTMIKDIKKLKNNPPNSMSISLDGADAKNHNFLRGTPCHEEVIKTIKAIKKHVPSIKIGINFLITSSNYKEIPKTVKLASDLGVNRFNLMPIHTNLQQKQKPKKSFQKLFLTPSQISDLKEIINKFLAEDHLSLSKSFIKRIPNYYSGNNSNHCYAGYACCTILANGSVAPCESLDPVGNINEKNFSQIWKSKQFYTARRKVKQCKELCYDTTYGELSNLFSFKGMIMEIPKIISNIEYYL